MAYKTVSGAQSAEIELDGSVYTVNFGHSYKYYAVRNDGSETIYVSTTDKSCTPKNDGVVSIPSGGSYVHCNGFGGNSEIYFSGNGGVVIIAQDDAQNPFNTVRKGGEKKSISAKMGYVSDGLMCHYSADSKNFTSGWRINDLSGNGNSGMFLKGNYGSFGQPIYLNNAENYINLNQHYIIMPQLNYEQVTIEAVCKFPITPSNEVDIISNLEAGGYCIYYNADKQQFVPYVRVGGVYRTTSGIPNDYLLHLFTATYDNNALKFYIDGVLVGETKIAGNIDFPEDNTVLAINANPSGGNASNTSLGIGTFNFYSARVYNKALSADEIMQNFLIDQSLFWGN